MTSPRDSAISFEAVKVSIRQDRNGYNLVLAIHPDDIPDALMRSWVGARYQVAMVQVGDDEQPVAFKGRGLIEDGKLNTVDTQKKITYSEGERLVRLAGELCREPAFQEWIAPNGNPRTEEQAAHWLRSILSIGSRKDLASNEWAAEAFRDIFSRYQADTGLGDMDLP